MILFNIFKKKTPEEKEADLEAKYSCYIGYLDHIAHPYVGFKMAQKISVKQFDTITHTNIKKSDCDLTISNIRLCGDDYYDFECDKDKPYAICIENTGFLFEVGFPLDSVRELQIE